MMKAPGDGPDTEAAASRYLLGRPLPLLNLSEICLTLDELTTIRETRLASMRELHRSELKRLGNQVRQARRRARLSKDDKNKASQLREVEQLRKLVSGLREQYKRQEMDVKVWVPQHSCPSGQGDIKFDPVKFNILGRKLEGYLQHIPSLFSVGWAGDGVSETLPSFSHRPVARETKAYDQRVLIRSQILNEAVFKEWVQEIYEIFCDWFPPTSKGRPVAGRTRFPGRLLRRTKPKTYTLQTVNHYIPGLKLTEGYLDELLKPLHRSDVGRPQAVQADHDLPMSEGSLSFSPLRAIEAIEERLRRGNRKHQRSGKRPPRQSLRVTTRRKP